MKSQQIPHTDLTVSRIAHGAGLLASVLNFKGPLVAEGQTDNAVAQWRADHKKDAIASWQKVGPKPGTIEAASRIVGTAVDCGINLFDHSGYYAFGKGEEIFGEVLKASPNLRQEIVIQSKCGLHFGGGDFFEQKQGDPPRVDLGRQAIVAEVEASLRRLGTDRLDILLLNRPDALFEPEEAAAAFDDLHEAGKVRHFGVSNHTPLQIELLRKHVRQPIVINQIQIGLAFPYAIIEGLDANRDSHTRLGPDYGGGGGILDYCRLHDIQVQAYSPLRGGNRVSPSPLLTPSTGAAPGIRQVRDLLAQMAADKGTTPAALALAWLLRHPAGIVPVIGAINPAHILEDCVADQVPVSAAEWYELLLAVLAVPGLRLFGVVMPPRYVAAAE